MAKKKKSTSLFKKLTRLFKSGPLVQRKIRTTDTTIAVPDKTKSSGTLLFQKSMSPTYATITSNAYNLSERLMRYQDFQEMEYSVHGGQLIASLDEPDGYIRIDELARRCAEDPEYTFVVYSYDHERKQIVPAVGKQARQTCVDHAWKVTFDSGQSITASPEHRLMLRDGTYRKVEDLQPGDAMMPFYRKDRSDKGYRWIYTMNEAHRGGWSLEHRLIAEWIAGRSLEDDEVVHHINFNKSDNRPENLRVMITSDHNSLHAEINNGSKWCEENHEWIERFKKNHTRWMRDNAPTRRRDITFARIVETCEHVGFNITALASSLDVSLSLIHDRLTANGFPTFEEFKRAYGSGQLDSILEETNRPGLLTRDLSLELIESVIVENDTKRSLICKLGCTVNVLDKFLNRRLGISWMQLRQRLGFQKDIAIERNEHRTGGRPKGSTKCKTTYHDVLNAMEPNLTRPRLAESLGVSTSVVMRILADNGYKKYSEFRDGYKNHKVVSIEYVGEIPLYDLTVDGYKNFATDSVISHNTPELSAALDIYADETCPQDERGRILHVYSDNEKIKEVLEDLFYNVLNVEFNARSWARNLPVRRDTVIPLLDGRNVTIENLAQELQDNPERQVWVYSIQEGTNKLVPGKVTWCGLTRQNTELVRVWLDDGTYVDTTPDHEVILRDGSRCRADMLSHGDSLMPFYRKNEEVGKDRRSLGYERVYDPGSKRNVYTHRVMAKHAWKRSDRGGVVHHVNLNRNDNRPANLRVMEAREHTELHKMLANSYNGSELHKKHNVNRSRAMKAMWNDPASRAASCENMRIKFDDECVTLAMRHIEETGSYIGSTALAKILSNDEHFISHFLALNSRSNRDLMKSLNDVTIRSLIFRTTGMLYHDAIAQRFPFVVSDRGFKIASKGSVTKHNHEVDRVEKLNVTDDVYCMEVLGPNGEHDRHNFMVCSCDGESGEVKHSNGICVSNCKYGDFFLYNDVSPEYGVVNAFPVPVNEIEREENYDRDDPFAVRFRWVTLGNRILENWELTHFRLLGNDLFLPYGSSIIEPARRIWRQLILIEDAMLVYRVVRAPDRRVFYIDVANIPADDIPAYVEEQKQNLRNSQVVDQESGRVDLRYNPLCFRGDTLVPLLDNRVIKLEDLVKEWNAGKRDHETYSIDLKAGGRIVPGKVVWAGQTGTTKQFVRITLDDGGVLEVTPDHKMMRRDGEPVKAKNLSVGDSLMPLHVCYSDMSGNVTDNALTQDSYEKVFDPASGRYYFTHRLIAAAKFGLEVYGNGFIAQQGCVIHHEDHNKLNNSSPNLGLMTLSEHSQHHSDLARKNITRYNKSPTKRARTIEVNRRDRKAQRMVATYNHSELHRQHNEIRSAAMKKMWNDPPRKQKARGNMRFKWSRECQSRVIELIKMLDRFEGLDAFLRRVKSDAVLLRAYRACNENFARDVTKSFHKNVVGRFIKKDYVNWKALWTAHNPVALGNRYVNNVDPTSFNVDGSNNHEVAAIEFIDVVDEPVFNVTVDTYHNLCVQAPNCAGTNNGKVESFQSVDEDYFIPVRGAETGTKIETLAGGQNTAAVEDVEYIQKKLFAALKIPRAYLGYDELLSCLTGETRLLLLNGSTITMEELAQRNDQLLDNNDPVWVHSCDPETGEMRPGRVVKAWKAKEVSELHLITLDNGHVIKCTENHPFLCRDGTYLRADELKVGQSLMAQRFKESSKHAGDFQNGYQKFLCNATNEWRFTHRLVNESITEGKHVVSRARVIHHADFNKLNNSPENLIEMTWMQHRKLHSKALEHTLLRPDVVVRRKRAVMKWLKSDRHRKISSELMKAQLTDPKHGLYRWIHGDEISKVTSKNMKEKWNDPAYRELKSEQSAAQWESEQYRDAHAGDNHWSRKRNASYDIEWLKEFCVCHRVTSVRQFRSDHKRTVAHRLPKGVSIRHVQSLLERSTHGDWRGFAKRELGIDVPNRGPRKGMSPCRSDFTIDDLRDFCVNHAVTTIGQWTKNHRNSVVDLCPVSGTVVKRVLRENGFKNFNEFKKTLKFNHKVVSINVVKLDNPVGVYDMEVTGFHNFLVVPDDMTGEEYSGIYVHNSKATLAQEDIRFSRSINVIQKTIIAELNKIAIIHLYAHGYDGEELLNFELRLSNPSTVAQQQKLELWRTKFDIAGTAPEGLVTQGFLRRNILELKPEEIATLDDERRREAKINASVEASGGGGGGGGGLGGGGGDLFGGGEEFGGEEFGGEEFGGEEELGGGEEELGGGEEEEEPEELEAGEDEDEEGLKLLTSADDDEGEVPIKDNDGDPPVKVSAQIKRNKYNRSRQRHHGASMTHEPEMDPDNETMNDPYELSYLKSVATNPLAELAGLSSSVDVNLSSDIVSMLTRMKENVPGFGEGGPPEASGMLTESEDVQEEIDRTNAPLELDVIEEGLDIDESDDHEL